ncbi:aprataxin and PNK-like factor isoform X2 [Dendronephthya gigantea]|uniref:aprataxin and PNK-like factor isoform X2 n=1 Tax=Dendronephthya gigantea TaxID=151771 RepID=UPI001069F8EF|nr:aprataxin and PNK-like factor isoform X2 [Dendronephthya gigantea]
MASFALISLENNYKVDISEGKVTVGRGPYLKITDKRVSRNHATLEVSDATFTVLPTHTNPTFYQACGDTKFEPLAKDEVKKLQDGDCISFLPNDLKFKVEIRDNGSIKKDLVAEESLESKNTNASDLNDNVLETNNKGSDDKNLSAEGEEKNLETTKGGSEVGQSPGGKVCKSPGDEVCLSPGGKVEVSPGDKVGLSPGGEMGQSPGGKLGKSPGSEVDQSPGGKVGQSPGGEVDQSPGGKVDQSPGGEVDQSPGDKVGQTPGGEASKKEDSPGLSDDAEESDEDFDEDHDKMEVEGTAQPLNKKRVLPGWMAKGKEPQENSAKSANKGKKVKVSAVEEKVDNDIVKSEDVSKENDKTEETEQKDDKEEVPAEKDDQEDAITEEESKKRKRDKNEDVEQSSKKEKKLPLCPYGARCYRKNPVHFQEYSHEQEESDNEENSPDDRAECPYGEYCYRQNPRHRRDYKHTPQPKTRERKAKKKAGYGKIRDNDEDAPNDYDFDDSFIDDESSESDHEASDNDSDWQPSGGDDDDDDEGEGEDVRELLTEARNFTKNKKMMRPT